MRHLLIASSLIPLMMAPIADATSIEPKLASGGAIITAKQKHFRDLNRDGKLEPYEDWRLAPAVRAKDLVSRMTLEEKAGTMMHGTLMASDQTFLPGLGTKYDLERAEALIETDHVSTFITRLRGSPNSVADQNNKLQALAARSRLGIPLTISSDPRHHFQATGGASSTADGFSQWPEPTGLAAINDAGLVRRFGDIARIEYRAVGIQQALSPMADLSTEPRWSRINGTFGDDVETSSRLVKAYIQGFQGGDKGLARDGVAAVVKHWVGYGASAKGFDGHNAYGRYAVFPAGQFEKHIIPFLGAFDAGVAGVMPTYAILKDLNLDGAPVEPVAAGFNRQLLTEQLRDKYHFKGVVLSDWAITNDCSEACLNGTVPGVKPAMADISTAWGVEALSETDRFAKGINAGIDQFGGTEATSRVVEAVKAGKVTEKRINQSVERILIVKFEQGLFEDPFVDATAADLRVGTPEFMAEGRKAQSEALVILENSKSILPIRQGAPLAGKKIFLKGVSPDVARAYGFTPVDSPDGADLALIRTATPFETLHPNYFFGSFQHEGNLAFAPGQADFDLIAAVAGKIPTIVSVYMDRPAILTALKDKPAALLAEFGTTDAALFDALTGKIAPKGKLPFELPSSMAEVEQQAEDAPDDTSHPLYPLHYGLGY